MNIAIIGAGNMGRRHTRAWARVGGARVVAVADVLKPKADALAAELQKDTGASAQAFGDARELLAGGGIDVVSVCAPTHLHRELTEHAASAGAHVFCEKPMALSVADCDAMIAACQTANVRLSVGQVVRFFPEFENAHRLIAGGAVGKPAAARTRRGGDFPRGEADWYADDAQSGGVIFDLLIHDFDWLLWCFGPVARVYAKGLTGRADLPRLDYALVTLRHESGVIAHVEGTWADPGGFATTFDIAGDNGLLTHDSRRAAPLVKSLRASGGDGAPSITTLSLNPLAPDDEPYFRQIAAFAQSVADNVAPAVTPQDARAAVAVAAAARRSLASGRAETVEDTSIN